MASTYQRIGQLGCLLVCLQCFWSPAESGKLLVIPVDGSHWLSMQVVLEELHERGHKIVVVYPENNLLIKTSLHYSSKIYSTAFSKADVDQFYKNLIGMAFYDGTFYQRISGSLQHVSKMRQFFLSICEDLLFSTELIQELAEEKFDALLSDPLSPCGAIVAEYLSLPSVNLLRRIPCGLDNLATQCPRPLSYVPRIFTGNTDRMTFLQRTNNVLASLLEPLWCHFIYSPFEELATKFLQRDVTLAQLLSQASIWLLRFDFVFEFPRPLMPNMVLVGGISCKERKPLPQDLEEFMNSSGEHGAVIFSLGSMMSEIPITTANQIAEALGQIPQKVLWRYTGERPSTLAPNTKLMKWLPQNDLLGHPKTRAFLTHGGSHGIYEAICSAVPMVMLPLFADQIENTEHIKRHGAGIALSLRNISSRGLMDALSMVINDTRYKESIMKLSSLHKDHLVHPVELAVHWVEFVMKHRGAEHLRPAAHDLNWIQYHCLNVFGLLLVSKVASVWLMVKCCLFCCRRCLCGARDQMKRKSD
ncbi:UDP-glucuronosyltransferase 1A1-like isoform X2 [Heterodontus francisci]|uniref:UDP-glucuronosyltransferase 1A1-like isoform X2 n=1 Tax=Heterodontus francisci TaxID=7792 RepID=UPI00355C8742